MEKKQERTQYNEIIAIVSAVVEFVGLLVDNGLLSSLAIFCFIVFIIIEFIGLYKDSMANGLDKESAKNINVYLISQLIKEEEFKSPNISKAEKIRNADFRDMCSEEIVNISVKNDRERREKIKAHFIKMAIGMGAIVFILIFSGEAISAYAKEVGEAIVERVDSLFNNSQEEDGDSETEQEDTEEEGEARQEMETETEQGTIVEGKTFKLDGPHKTETVEDRVSAAVFYVNCNEENLEASVQAHIMELLDKDEEDTYNGELGKTENDLITIIDENEKGFNTAVSLVEAYAEDGDYEKWNKTLKSSEILDNIIDWRVSIWEDGFRNANIASLIANDHQQYAMEYQAQKIHWDSALYHYMKAIQWTEYALIYEDANEEQMFNYIKARYKDIMDCEEFSDIYRKDAEAIYEAMGEYEAYLDTEK